MNSSYILDLNRVLKTGGFVFLTSMNGGLWIRDRSVSILDEELEITGSYMRARMSSYDILL